MKEHPYLLNVNISLTDADVVIPELKDIAWFDHPNGRYDQSIHSVIRCTVPIDHLSRVYEPLIRKNLHIASYFFMSVTPEQYWTSPDDDCVGAIIGSDGHIPLINSALYWKVVPIEEPFYIMGRPEGGGEHNKSMPHCIHAGGIPIVSDGLLNTFRLLNADVRTAPLIYRGHNRKAFDTIQPGYQRVLLLPELALPVTSNPTFLSPSLTQSIRINSLLRARGDDQWYEIVLNREMTERVHLLRRSVLLDPVFDSEGCTFQAVQACKVALESLK